jgi:hypothetical protein
MMTPQKANGNQASGKAKVMIAQHILTTALVDLGVQSTEGQAVLDALKMLVKKFGKTEEDSKQIMPAELMMAMQRQAGPGQAPGAKPGMPPPGAAPPQQAAAA